MIKHFKTGEIVKVMDENDKTRYRSYSARILRVFDNESKYEVELLDEHPPAKTMVVYDYNVFPHYPRFYECDYIQSENGTQYEVLGLNEDNTKYILSRIDLGENDGKTEFLSVGYIDSYCNVQSRVLNGIRFFIGDEVVINSDPERVWKIFYFLPKSVILKKDTATIELNADDILTEDLRKNPRFKSVELYDGFTVKVGDYVYYDDPLYIKLRFFKEKFIWKVVSINSYSIELKGVIGIKGYRTKVFRKRFKFIKPVSIEEWYRYVEGIDMELSPVNLDKEQIRSLIEIALIMHDKQWFDELVERLNKMK